MSDYMPNCATCEHFESCIMQKHITEMALILWNISREKEKPNNYKAVYPCDTCINKGDHNGECSNCVADSESIRWKTPSHYKPKTKPSDREMLNMMPCEECGHWEHGAGDHYYCALLAMGQECYFESKYESTLMFANIPMDEQTEETEMERLERIDNEIEDAWARIRELTEEPQTCSFSDCDNFKNPDYERCIKCKRKQIKPKTLKGGEDVHEFCKKCGESKARMIEGERYIVCEKASDMVCISMKKCPLNKWVCKDTYIVVPQTEREGE